MKTRDRFADPDLPKEYAGSPAEPTPEQIADRGQIDGVPVVALDQWRRERLEKVKYQSLFRKNMGRKKGREIIRGGEDGIMTFASSHAAALSVPGAYADKVRKAAAGGRAYKGYQWSYTAIETSKDTPTSPGKERGGGLEAR